MTETAAVPDPAPEVSPEALVVERVDGDVDAAVEGREERLEADALVLHPTAVIPTCYTSFHDQTADLQL